MPESWKVSYAAMAVMALVGLFTVVFPLCLGRCSGEGAEAAGGFSCWAV